MWREIYFRGKPGESEVSGKRGWWSAAAGRGLGVAEVQMGGLWWGGEVGGGAQLALAELADDDRLSFLILFSSSFSCNYRRCGFKSNMHKTS